MSHNCVHLGHCSDAGVAAEQFLGDAGHLVIAPGLQLPQLWRGKGMLVHVRVHGRTKEQRLPYIPSSNHTSHQIIANSLRKLSSCGSVIKEHNQQSDFLRNNCLTLQILAKVLALKGAMISRSAQRPNSICITLDSRKLVANFHSQASSRISISGGNPPHSLRKCLAFSVMITFN